MGFETNPGPPKPGQGEANPVEENPTPWNPGPDPAPEPGPEPQPPTDPGVDPDAEKPKIDASGFLRSLAGTWTLSVGGSAWGANAPIGDLEGKVTLEMDATGGFVGDLPRVEVHQVGMDITVSAAIAGELAVTAFDPATRRYTVEPRNVSFTRREITLSNGKASFGLGFLVGPIIDAIVKSSVITGELWVEAWGDQQCLFYASGGSGQKFVRPGVSGEMVELSFVNDHKMLRKADTHLATGEEIKPPHWTSGGVNAPVTYAQGATVEIEATVVVKPAGRLFTLQGAAASHPFATFKSAVATATGAPQKITMTATGPLPSRIEKLAPQIAWTIRTADKVEQTAHLGSSGPHVIYALWGPPIITNSKGRANFITTRRIESAVGFVMKGLHPNSVEMDDVARGVSYAVNNYVNAAGVYVLDTGFDISIDYRKDFENQIWGVLDEGSIFHGHCGEATFLMEQALRALGVPARQTHVYARTDRASLDREENLSFEEEEPIASREPARAQTRICRQHGAETLCLNFSSKELAINTGEGCVMVNGRLYPGLLRFSDIVGIAWNGVTASQDLLLKLEGSVFGWAPAPNAPLRFQVWVHEVAGGGNAGCELEPEDSGHGPWTVWVPPR